MSSRFWPQIVGQDQTSKAKATAPRPEPTCCSAKTTTVGLNVISDVVFAFGQQW